MKTKVTAVLLAAMLAVSGCQGDQGQKQGVGTLLGAGLGALLGSQVGGGKGQLAAVAVGTLLGAAIGSEIGKQMDSQDVALAQQAELSARDAPTGERIAWENPDSGNHGHVTPVRNGTDAATGDFCREFQTEIIVGGQVESAYGTACQRPDGSWEIVN